MKKILILGGYGLTGRLLARHLLEQTGIIIVLAGRHLGKAEAYAEQLNGEFKDRRVSAIKVDASSGESLCKALVSVNLLLVAAPVTKHANTVIRAVLDSKVDYLDIQLDVKKTTLLKSLAPEIENAGLCYITEAGFHPGLPSAMVCYAALQLDRLDSAAIAGYLNMGQAFPQMYATLKELGFFMSGTHWIVDWIITPLVLAGLKLAPHRGIHILGKLMW